MSKRTWRSFYKDINNSPTAARIHKVLAKDYLKELGLLQKADGNYAENL